ncbi:S41 family peptidase [Hymenobacter crusticola]|uniref:Tail specific protease domain-containing protein n=1 Tax=Hymenobacter crusticola TaxID=1770526 RepID=A0A2C9ZVG2_9BACT|nr:S41 family peptidase [Hymenobacter crusticola]OUJ70427.1 hypothetical protein BXP70_23980 [Hymenobacter crusticola]
MRNWFLLLSLCALVARALAQTAPLYDPTTRYTIPQLQADLAYVRHALEEAHPALYWYTPKDSLDRAFNRAAAALTHPMDEPEFWRLLQLVVVQLHCGHTRVQHSPTYRAWFRRQPHAYLPFTVAIRQNRLFVAENQSSTPELWPGTEILALDGHPTSEVLARLRSLIAADGYGTGFQDHELEAGFFDTYYWDFYEAKPVYPLLVRDSTGCQHLLTPQPRLPRAGAAKVPSPVSAEQERAQQLARQWSVRYPAELPATAILRIREFSYDQFTDYQQLHTRFFTDLAQRHTKRLVIDLRGNLGGNMQLASDLLKYLLQADFVLTKSALAPVFIPSFLQPDSTKAAYFDTTQVRRLPEGVWGFASPSVGVQHPYPGRYFQGQLVLLVDGGTFSAASNFAASLRAQRSVLLLGQETGGGEAGTSGGHLSRLELPQTHLVLQLPHFRLLTACAHPQLGRGVRPDQEVVPTPQQIAKHADAVLLQLPKLLQ